MNNSLLVPGIFAALAALYLVAIPLALYFWMNTRWYIMGKFERLGIYGLVFLFFPGLILFSPFLNLPKSIDKQTVDSLKKAGKEAVEKHIIPTFKDVKSFRCAILCF